MSLIYSVNLVQSVSKFNYYGFSVSNSSLESLESELSFEVTASNCLSWEIRKFWYLVISSSNLDYSYFYTYN